MQMSVCDAAERHEKFNAKSPKRKRYFNQKEGGDSKGYVGQDFEPSWIFWLGTAVDEKTVCDICNNAGRINGNLGGYVNSEIGRAHV